MANHEYSYSPSGRYLASTRYPGDVVPCDNRGRPYTMTMTTIDTQELDELRTALSAAQETNRVQFQANSKLRLKLVAISAICDMAVKT